MSYSRRCISHPNEFPQWNSLLQPKYIRYPFVGAELFLEIKKSERYKLYSEKTKTLIIANLRTFIPETRVPAQVTYMLARYSAENFLNVPSEAAGRSVRK